MIFRKPDYYNEFQCIGSECKHTCCASWEIEVDEMTYDYYKSVEGEFGEKLRACIKEGKEPHFKMHHGNCAFLGKDHLCEIYKNLGEEALCETCTEYPRSTEDYGEQKEMTLGLSCEEVGRILFSKKSKIQFEEMTWDDGFTVSLKDENEEDANGFAVTLEDEDEAEEQNKDKWIKSARDHCIDRLQDRKLPLAIRMEAMLRFCEKVQVCMDCNKYAEIMHIIEEDKAIDWIQASKEKNQASKNGDRTIKEMHTLFQKRMDIFVNMEVMEEEWEQLIENVIRAFHADTHRQVYLETTKQFFDYWKEHEYEFEHILVYFTYRYLRKAVEDHAFLDRARFCVSCFLTILDMDRMKYLLKGEQFTTEDQIDTMRVFSRQIEHSQNSLEYLREKVRTESCFQVEALILQMYNI